MLTPLNLPAEHSQHKACCLAAAVVCLRYKVLERRVEDHGQRLGLNQGRPLKLHLNVQSLEQLGTDGKFLECFGRCVDVVARVRRNRGVRPLPKPLLQPQR